ncbi:MAG: response regulator [Candidatus Omnitrophota bacterium]
MAKILVVDNEKEIVKLMQKILAKEGFEVLTAFNGEECLELAEKERPNLILIDIHMPGMDGGMVVQNLKSKEETKNIPFIYLTGLINEKEADSLKGTTAEKRFLSKQSDLGEIVKKIKEVLSVKE